MEEKKLVELCREVINDLTWDETDYFNSIDFDMKLSAKIKKEFSEDYNADGWEYAVFLVKEFNWKNKRNDGYNEYYNRNLLYQLIRYKLDTQSSFNFPKDIKTIVEKYNIYFKLIKTKEGSNLTKWDFRYKKPTIIQKKIVHIPKRIIPEQIIPAHDEEKWEVI